MHSTYFSVDLIGDNWAKYQLHALHVLEHVDYNPQNSERGWCHQSQPHPHLQLLTEELEEKHVNSWATTPAPLVFSTKAETRPVEKNIHSEGGGFSTCSEEQHSQNSFLLLRFITMLGDVQLSLDLCLSCTCPLLLLSSRTHTVYTDCTTTWHWHSRQTCVWSAQKTHFHCFKEKKESCKAELITAQAFH